MKVRVTHKKLEHTEPPAEREPKKIVTRQVLIPNAALNRFFYVGVGSDWLWYAKRDWTYEQWDSLARSDGYHTWVAYHNDTPVGYFELDSSSDSCVEIASFGLLPEYIGMGLGRELIQGCLARAWGIKGTELVWLSTCTLDHPGALRNYLNAGFQEVHSETVWEDIPEHPLEPWPGSGRLPVTVVSDHQ